jgi:hypothetical protein
MTRQQWEISHQPYGRRPHNHTTGPTELRRPYTQRLFCSPHRPAVEKTEPAVNDGWSATKTLVKRMTSQLNKKEYSFEEITGDIMFDPLQEAINTME